MLSLSSCLRRNYNSIKFNQNAITPKHAIKEEVCREVDWFDSIFRTARPLSRLRLKPGNIGFKTRKLHSLDNEEASDSRTHLAYYQNAALSRAMTVSNSKMETELLENVVLGSFKVWKNNYLHANPILWCILFFRVCNV